MAEWWKNQWGTWGFNATFEKHWGKKLRKKQEAKREELEKANPILKDLHLLMKKTNLMEKKLDNVKNVWTCQRATIPKEERKWLWREEMLEMWSWESFRRLFLPRSDGGGAWEAIDSCPESWACLHPSLDLGVCKWQEECPCHHGWWLDVFGW